MHPSPGYILLLVQQPRVLGFLNELLKQCRYSVAITCSEAQAVAHTLHQPPFLIIVAGDRHHWPRLQLQELRSQANTHQITLIALTDTNAPSWVYQEENPGFDGFLVNPISIDILSSLIHSAQARQHCYSH